MAKKDGHGDSRSMICNISYVAGVLGLKNTDLARIMGISPSLYYQRKSRPWTIRVGELEKLADYAGRQGIKITAAQLLVPFKPAEVRGTEETA